MTSPIRTGIVGMGGYAGSHQDALLKLEEKGLARLVCTCDPHPELFSAQRAAWRLRERGVYVFSDYREMLDTCARHLDLVVVPTPVHLHAEIHRAAVQRGLAVYLEKPPTLDPQELEAMIECDHSARRASLVGFNFILEPPRLELKQRLLDGEFGEIREVALRAAWSRPTAYFRRCPSAGRLFVGEKLVLDSCLSNEHAHFVHNSLFWAGRSGLMSWPSLLSVRAELYRAHLIESADTVFAEARTTEGTRLRFALTLAHAGTCSHEETVTCDKAILRYSVGKGAEVRWLDNGKVEQVAWTPFDPLLQNHVAYLRFLTSGEGRPATTLPDCRAFVALNALAFASSGSIAAIPAQHVSLVCNSQDRKDYVAVEAMDAVLDRFVHGGEWPSKTGWPRAQQAVVVGPERLPSLRDTLRPLAAVVPV